MPISSRSARSKLPHSGPYKAIVTSHMDPTYMGSLEVILDKSTSGNIKNQNETFIVSYLSPFAGVSSIRFEGNNSANWQDAQKSYGFWAVPPDIGTTVLCMFIDGDPNQGYWFGCTVDTFQNYMIPGLAASKNVAITTEQERKYGTRVLPVAESVKGVRSTSIGKPDTFTKPIHPFADRLLAQGLLLDAVRGVTSSSARRETPSQVFGISTPGPLDTNGRKAMVGYGGQQSPQPVSRLGGSTFVMDDGDADGQNELVRIRTRTGHQILLHNSHDLIYIAHGSGKSWIEMTSDGKIDIYAKDSVSVHSEADFNFRADRDINLEAGRNLNISVGNNMQTDVGVDYTLVVGNNGKILFSNDLDKTVGKNSTVSVGSDFNLGVGGNMFQSTTFKMHLYSASDMYVQSSSDLNIKAGDQMFQESTNVFNVKSGSTYRESAIAIHMNSGDQPATPATKATVASSAEVPSVLPVFKLPNRSKEAGWDDGKFYKEEDITSIMKRVPTHEPWDHHESINQNQFSWPATDTSIKPPTTIEEIKEFQRRNGLKPDGIVGPKTLAKMKELGVVPEYTQPNYNRADMPADWTKDLAFIEKVKSVAKELNCSFIDLLCCMAWETGNTFSTSIKNPSSTATGLIQFTEGTARGLKTTTAALARMSRVEQMDYVLRHFKSTPLRKVAKPTIEDLYMAILRPAAVTIPADTVLFTDPGEANAPRNAAGKRTDVYWINRGLDVNKDGKITKAEAAAKVRAKLPYIRAQLLTIPEEAEIWTDSEGNPITDSEGNPIRGGYYPPKSN